MTPRDIQDDEWLVRAIPHDGFNEQTGEPNTFYFKSAELSTSVLSQQSIALLLSHSSGYREMAALNVGFCRELGLEVEHTPIQDEPDLPDNPEHVSIRMPKAGRASKARKLKIHAIRVPVAFRTPTQITNALIAALP